MEGPKQISDEEAADANQVYMKEVDIMVHVGSSWALCTVCVSVNIHKQLCIHTESSHLAIRSEVFPMAAMIFLVTTTLTPPLQDQRCCQV